MTVPITVAIDHGDGITGAGRVRMCEVPGAVGAPISNLFDRAVSRDTPANCVTSLRTSADRQRLIQLNGVTARSGSRIWRIRQDGVTVSLSQPLSHGALVFASYEAP